ncbi:ABC transporter permease [Trinickia diaoshuihuensis]|uniref:ABC transporter permease n=1 Tax=Trinickia diaoshuihuensis TaxID=2292265 RepID=UPI000E226CC6|nr:ABC transporter permease [Trinickia diaoshuihuensis]
MRSRERQRLVPAGPLAWAVLLFLYLPLAALVWMSFNAGPSALAWQGWGMHGYIDAARDMTLRRASVASLLLATASTILSTSLALAAAVASWHATARKRFALTAWIAVPLVVPEIVLALGTLLLFSALSIEPGFVTVLFAHVVFCLPFAYLPISARLARIDRQLLEAAADLSATPWSAFRQITLPLATPGIVAGAMLAFVASMNDYLTSYFLAGAGLTTLPMYIFSALKLGLTPKINAISTAIVGVALLQLAGVWLVRSDRHPHPSFDT